MAHNSKTRKIKHNSHLALLHSCPTKPLCGPPRKDSPVLRQSLSRLVSMMSNTRWHTTGVSWRVSVLAKRNTNIISNRAVMRNPIRRIGEYARARRRRRRTPRMKTSMVGRCQRESLGPKRISVDLADIIADLTTACVSVPGDGNCSLYP